MPYKDIEKAPRLIRLMRDPASVNGTAIRTGLERMCLTIRSLLGSSLVMYEVGSFAGEAAEIFAQHFAEVHCVDLWQDYPLTGDAAKYTWPEIEASFDSRALTAMNVFKHKGDGSEIAKSVPDESLDFVYIDADHSYASVKRDLESWVGKVRANGFIGGHDYTFWTIGVVHAVNEFFHIVDEGVILFHDGSWLLQKLRAKE